MNTEGAALEKVGKYPEAERLLLASLDGLAQAPIPNLTDKGRERLLDLYTAWGRPTEAAKYRAAN
jgi:hypothetical protein